MLETGQNNANDKSGFRSPYDKLVEKVKGKIDYHKYEIGEAFAFIKNPNLRIKEKVDSIFLKQISSPELAPLRAEIKTFKLKEALKIIDAVWQMHSEVWGHNEKLAINKELFLVKVMPQILNDLKAGQFKPEEFNFRLQAYRRLIGVIRFDIELFQPFFADKTFAEIDNETMKNFSDVWSKLWGRRFFWGHTHIKAILSTMELTKEGISKEIILAFGTQTRALEMLLGEKLFDVVYVKNFIVNIMGKSIENIKKLRFIEKFKQSEIEILRFTLDHSPKDFNKVLNLINVSNSLGIEIPPNIMRFLLNLENMSVDSFQKFFTVLNKVGVSGISFEKFAKILERYKKAKARNDIGTQKALFTEIKSHLIKLIVPYFTKQISNQVITRVAKEFGLDRKKVGKVNWELFASTYRMLIRLEDSRNRSHHFSQLDFENVRKMLANYLNEGGVQNWLLFTENQNWLNKNVPKELQEEFISGNERKFNVGGQITGNAEERIAFHRSETFRLFEEMGIKITKETSVEGLIFKFKDLKQNKIAKRLTATYKDLSTQIEALEQLRALSGRTSTKMPKEIKIKRETDPVMITQMGTFVNGSCLNADGANFWSTFSNALDVNKSVCYIRDENGNLLGRVLFAIDKNKQIVRFPVYYTDQCNFDLNPFVNSYIREFAGKYGLSTNGISPDVNNLVFSDWYKDPPVKI